jgi:hypothetical protein
MYTEYSHHGLEYDFFALNNADDLLPPWAVIINSPRILFSVFFFNRSNTSTLYGGCTLPSMGIHVTIYYTWKDEWTLGCY